jgi:hypothetical protein
MAIIMKSGSLRFLLKGTLDNSIAHSLVQQPAWRICAKSLRARARSGQNTVVLLLFYFRSSYGVPSMLAKFSLKSSFYL